MHELRVGIAAFLLANVLAGLVRMSRGPSLPDRIMVAQLFGTTGVAILLMLSLEPGRSFLRGVALVFALLSAIMVIALVRTTAPRERAREPEKGREP
jgi:multicomponent Na+:H+ antiporter subunit F